MAGAAEFLHRSERALVGGAQDLLVLRLLQREKALHGYALIRCLDDATGNRSLWKEGTIYPLLAVLEREGLVASRWGDPESGPRRKYYHLTPAGRQALRVLGLAWQDLKTTVDETLG